MIWLATEILVIQSAVDSCLMRFLRISSPSAWCSIHIFTGFLVTFLTFLHFLVVASSLRHGCGPIQKASIYAVCVHHLHNQHIHTFLFVPNEPINQNSGYQFDSDRRSRNHWLGIKGLLLIIVTALSVCLFMEYTSMLSLVLVSICVLFPLSMFQTQIPRTNSNANPTPNSLFSP